MTFGTALTGLNAATSDLNATAHNISNTATVGFKYSRAEFADLFATTMGGSLTSTGMGVRTARIAPQFSPGPLTQTENALDLAIDGQGFFVVKDGKGSTYYTRAGQFQPDGQGYVETAEGQRLQVYAAEPVAASPIRQALGGITGQLGQVAGLQVQGPQKDYTINTGKLQDLKIDESVLDPKATTNVDVSVNLSANDKPPSASRFKPDNPESYNYATSTTVYDSLGVEHTMTTYFIKDRAGTWTARIYVDGNSAGRTRLNFDRQGKPGNLTSTAISFNIPKNGTLSLPVVGTISAPRFVPNIATQGNGAGPMTFTVNFGDSTQYDMDYAVNSVTQDGYTMGAYAGLSIDTDGTVYSLYTNGEQKAMGQVALAKFINAQGLMPQGDTLWQEYLKSGQAVYGQAGTSGFGVIRSKTLEGSNVDLSAQLVRLIIAQRNFQGNVQSITAEDNNIQTILQVGR